jgi:hypothetical protein
VQQGEAKKSGYFFSRHLHVRLTELSINFHQTVNIKNVLVIADSILFSRFPLI